MSQAKTPDNWCKELSELILQAMTADAEVVELHEQCRAASSKANSAECAATNAWNAYHKALATYKGYGIERSDARRKPGNPIQ